MLKSFYCCGFHEVQYGPVFFSCINRNTSRFKSVIMHTFFSFATMTPEHVFKPLTIRTSMPIIHAVKLTSSAFPFPESWLLLSLASHAALVRDQSGREYIPSPGSLATHFSGLTFTSSPLAVSYVRLSRYIC